MLKLGIGISLLGVALGIGMELYRLYQVKRIEDMIIAIACILFTIGTILIIIASINKFINK